MKKEKLNYSKIKRQIRTRSKIYGTVKRPRLSVHKTNTCLFAQIIDDSSAKTLIGLKVKGKNIKSATDIGQQILESVRSKKITNMVFDRGRYRYHGVVKKIAETVREGGIKL